MSSESFGLGLANDFFSADNVNHGKRGWKSRGKHFNALRYDVSEFYPNILEDKRENTRYNKENTLKYLHAANIGFVITLLALSTKHSFAFCSFSARIIYVSERKKQQ